MRVAVAAALGEVEQTKNLLDAYREGILIASCIDQSTYKANKPLLREYTGKNSGLAVILCNNLERKKGHLMIWEEGKSKSALSYGVALKKHIRIRKIPNGLQEVDPLADILIAEVERKLSAQDIETAKVKIHKQLRAGGLLVDPGEYEAVGSLYLTPDLAEIGDKHSLYASASLKPS